MKYFVKIRDREWVYHYSEKEQHLNDQDNRPLSYDLQELGNGCYSFILEGKSYLAHLHKQDDGSYEVLLGNQTIPVQIEDETSLLLKQFNKSRGTEATEMIVKAPIPGLVTKVLVNEGDVVDKDTTLLTLEAMKMENVIKAPCNCKVKKILVGAGETVQQNQPLIELQENETPA